MDYILGTILLFIFCLAISKYEYAKYSTYLTPFGVLAWPYTIIVIMINFGGVHFGFFPVSFVSIFFMIITFTFFFIGGNSILFFIMKEGKQKLCINNENKFSSLSQKYYPFFIIVAGISLIAGFYHLLNCIREFGITNIWKSDFKSAFGTGPLSHVMILSRPAFIFLSAEYLFKKRKSVLLILILLLVIVFARQVKYHIFGMILGGYFFCILQDQLKFSLKKIMIYSAIIFLLFSTTYFIGFFAVSKEYALSKQTHGWLLNLFFAYLFGGPIGFSEILKDSTYPIYSYKEIIAVPINIYKFLIGDESLVDIIIHNWIPISNRYDVFHSTNIFGMVGMLYMYLGPYITIIYMFCLGMMMYIIFYMAYKYKTQIGIQLIFSFFMCYLTVSFFDLYFNKLILYEASVYMLLFPLLYIMVKYFINLRLPVNSSQQIQTEEK